MSLNDRIADDLKESMKARNAGRVSVLRMIKATIKNKEIEKQSALCDDDIHSVLSSFAKRSRESIDQFSQAGRTDLAEKEENELKVIESYLPQQLEEKEIRDLIRDTIQETSAEGPRDMGKVMKAVMARAKGRADGKLVNSLVKEMLEG
jgi:uncharacterized protein YqeY